MPKVPNSTNEEALNLSPQQMFEEAVKNGNIHMSLPVVTTGINRKINTGNYENIDVFMAVSLPVFQMPTTPEELEKFKEAVSEAAKEGFLEASRNTGDRYNMIKELQSGGR